MLAEEEQQLVAWPMSEEEERYLASMPEVVEFWCARSCDDVLDGTFYLTEERGVSGFRALAHSVVFSVLERVAMRRAQVIAVDLDRCCAQVVLVV